jgi:2'-5' RNA ligase
MARPTANLRLFAAIYPPADVAAALLAAATKLELPEHRLTPVEQVHLTVQFIGDTPSRELDDTLESLQSAASGLSAFSLTWQRLITLPQRGAARLVAAETDQPSTLMELHRRLVTRLARNVRARSLERFRPHMTLCRFTAPVKGVRFDQPLLLNAFQVNRIIMMRSTLGPAGAKHHEVGSATLD